jgi:hypothetical protein
MEKSTPVFKFATLRNPSDVVTTNEHQIKPETALSLALRSINLSDIEYKLKMEGLNAKIQGFIDTSDYIRTKEDFATIKNETPSETILNVLFDNIIVRTLTRDTTNEIYKLITAYIVVVFKTLKSIPEGEKCRIVIPEGLAIAINEAPEDAEEPAEEPIVDQKAILKEINKLSEFEQKISRAKTNRVISFNSSKEVVRKNVEHQNIILAFNKSKISVEEAQEKLAQRVKEIDADMIKTRVFNQDYENLGPIESNVKAQTEASASGILEVKQHNQFLSDFVDKAKSEGVKEFTDKITDISSDFENVLTYFKKETLTIDEADTLIKQSMAKVSSQIHKIAPVKKFSFMGDKWVETTNISKRNNIIYPGGIKQQKANCMTKIPYLIADLKVVEQTTVGYLPGEIASINNTQAGEDTTRVTRRLKTVDSYESLINEDTTFQETDTQSTDRTSISSEASKIQNDSSAFSVNASAAASYGPVSATVDTGYTNSNSTTNANTSSIYQAKEVVQNIVNSVTSRVYSERSTRTIEEFEETVTHKIENAGKPTTTYVYRWLDKLVRAKLINYGKRLIFQFDIAHPSHYYLAQVIKQDSTIDLPDDPRKIKIDGNPLLTIDNISRDNYLVWASFYKADVEQAPIESIIVSEVLNGKERTLTGKLIPIKKDYKCHSAIVSTSFLNAWNNSGFMVFMLGNAAFEFWRPNIPSCLHPLSMYLNDETEQIPVSIMTGDYGFVVNIEIECILTERAYKEWQINTYNAIIDGYEKLKSEAEETFSSFNPNMPGLNPSQKLKIIKDELKKETIKRMSKCNPFWINDNYKVGFEYNQNCCLDKTHGEKIRFLETTFDWDNMTYEFHPYYYTDKNNWSQLLGLTDSDPHFESFLQASFSTIRVPVHRDNLKEISALNFLYNNSIANYEVVPEHLQSIVEEMKDNAVATFTEDINGDPEPDPINVKDLGVFNIPTSLVILEYGVSDGVKLRGYPEDKTELKYDMEIPKQYSPAIITDNTQIVEPE